LTTAQCCSLIKTIKTAHKFLTTADQFHFLLSVVC